ncbi:hypothetical protein P8452_35501 [Trifolium repens]|nr:hypothetical protein P8452_35501 [Trifolium repens]
MVLFLVNQEVRACNAIWVLPLVEGSENFESTNMSNGMEMFIKIHGKKKKSFRERALNYLTSAKDSSVQALIDDKC